ncbi:hypothetical protein D3872_23660 [Massilia cavernae]|uniref:PNPLA domain-containing protein n=2 Tax=Massilia cavernae TaxID=2320864 RepID=A0A418X7S6_9BURK|nr:hypothetical protein D3872_23660 [Massilia cavernae]
MGEPLLALACAGATLALGAFVLKPRSWFDTKLSRLPGSEATRRFVELQRRTVVMLVTVIILSFVLLAAIWWRPVEVTSVVTAPALLCFAFASWILFGDLVLIYYFRHLNLPSMAALPLVLLVVFSAWNDNHAVALLDEPPGPAARPIAPVHLQAWLAERRNSGALVAGKPFPLFLVAAEGGGIRGAYWTALVLSKLQDDSRGQFGSHAFALSGVSGGSLGNAVFAALVAEDQAGLLAVAPCARQSPARYQACATAVLRRDFLSPILGYLLYPDMVQRFLPMPVPAADRARAMETAWRSGWAESVGSNRLGERFDRLWQGPRGLQVPSLLLNATLVDGGNRIIASNIAIDGSFPDAFDASDELIDLRRMSMATAVHNSARFSYISPAGTVYACREGGRLAPCAPGRERGPWGRVIDGGYFENSGVETVRDLLFAIQPVLRAWHDDGYVIEPVVMVISNSPGAIAPSGKLDPNTARMDATFLSELLAPPLGLFNTRAARATFAVTAERRDMSVMVPSDGERFLWFGITTNNDTPLAWALADRTFDGIDNLLQTPQSARLPFSQVQKRLQGR